MNNHSNRTMRELLDSQKDNNEIAIMAPDKPSLTYKQIYEYAGDLSAALNQFGIGLGDRVAIIMENGPELILSFLATTMKATAFPLNPMYKEEEFAFYLEDIEARALITLPEANELALKLAKPGMVIIQANPQANGSLTFELIKGELPARPEQWAGADDVAMLLHTSGTTGRPKRVPLSHANLIASTSNIVSTYELTSQDRSLCILPLFHIHGIVASALSTLASGGTLICPKGFSARRFWDLVHTYKPTWYTAVPTIHQIILTRVEEHEEIVKNNPFRFVRSCSSSLPPVVLERMEKAYNAPVLEAYGMSEAAHQMTSNPLPPKSHKSGSVGIGFGVDIGIMDEEGNLLPDGEIGEVVIRGANVFNGYDENQEANEESFTDGWFRTGDQGMKDEEGYLFLTGRLKELINRGGEKISPFEIDDVLLRHPSVVEAVSFGAPSKMYGEEVHAALLLKEKVNEDELKTFCSDYLARFKVPVKFHLLEEIPRGATGKIQRTKMAELLGLTT
ncbi:AMP-dependent synthetase [Ammoniphilus oxalaticus]|uniref:AMP-dependent synthetase n=1 Tax=Ammoniphilus oxalaticus TaxID=66863 RepID=A0A419SKN7_9BACL|nr:acyl--CoA ligase [Ammoniphilus oxalaticus]RKD24574.1 AMP-dependent synthetase [Ammoniphilus oxalaticus]